jgi:hypothetical protein
MKKRICILQTNITIDSETMDNQMALIFVQGNQVVSTHVVAFPSWFNFYNAEYPYYSPCFN